MTAAHVMHRRRWRSVSGLWPTLFVLALLGAGFLFLQYGQSSVELFLAGDRAFGDWASLPGAVFFALLVVSLIMNLAGYRGEIRKIIEGGVVWRRSVQSRLQTGGQSCFVFVIMPDFLAAIPAFWSAGEPARAVVSGLVLMLMTAATGISFVQMVSLRPVLALDPSGIQARGLPGGRLEWDQIAAVFLDDNGPGGVVSLSVEGGKAGSKRLTLDLQAAGLTGTAFIKQLGEIAPQVEVWTPMSGRPDFG